MTFGTDFFFNNPYVTVPPGYTYDTVFIQVKNDRFVEGTETVETTSRNFMEEISLPIVLLHFTC